MSFVVGGVSARAAIAPRDRAELATAIGDLYAAGQAFAVIGGGTERELGNPPSALDTVVQTTALNRVLEYAPEDQTITVEAGITLGALDRVLAEHRQMLPVDVGDRERATIGGMLATNAFGPRRAKYGSLRDMILGVELVRPDGTRVRGGGKVVKNVAGFDLPKLVVGSLGTLGAIAGVTLRVYPEPPVTRAIVARDLRQNVEQGDALAAALLAERLEPIALAWHRGLDGDPAYAFFAGSADVVEAQVQRALALAREIAGSVAIVDEAELAAFWEYERDVRRRGAWRARTYTAPSLVNLARETAVHGWSGAQLAACYPSLGVFLASGVDDGSSLDDVTAMVRITRLEALGETIFHTMPARWRGYVDAWGDPPPAFPIMRALKTAFDPKGLCNPGRFVGGL